MAGRNERYVDLNVRFTTDVALSAMLLKLFPAFLKPCVPSRLSHPSHRRGRLVGRYLTPMRRAYREGDALMRDFIDARKRAAGPDKPVRDHAQRGLGSSCWWAQDDMLQWMLDAGDAALGTDTLVRHILRLNFSAMHTTLIVRTARSSSAVTQPQ